MDTDRLQYLFGPDAIELLADFDLEDESDRAAAVDELLPLDWDDDLRGAKMAFRAVAVSQILLDEPPDTWRTVERLRSEGLDRDEVLEQISLAIAEQIGASVSARTTYDAAAFVESLDRLPYPTAWSVGHLAVDAVRAQPAINCDTLTDHLMEALAPHRGPIIENLVDRAVEELCRQALVLLPTDAMGYVPDLVDGRTFTFRFEEPLDDDARDELVVAFDLGAFSRFDTVRLSDGTELGQYPVDQFHLVWDGPEGWLDAFAPGELLAVTASVVAPDGGVEEPIVGTITIEPVTSEPEMNDAAVSAVRAGYDEIVAEPGTPVYGEELALWLCFYHPDLFTSPLPPLQELCAAAGLEHREGRVAHDEEIWRRDVAVRRLNAAMAMVPDKERRLTIGRALDVLDDPGAAIDEVRAALGDCARDDILDVLADVLFAHGLDLADRGDLDGADAPGRLFELVDRATAVVRRPREIVTAEYLACVLHERAGAPELAEEHLARASNAGAQLGSVIERMGWYRFDRGDARGAMRWWRELEELPPGAAIIQPFLSPAGGHKLGRNEPCWCGSGRKFKQCHQNAAAELPALPDRVAWLCRKATTWLEHASEDVRMVTIDLAAAFLTGDPDDDTLPSDDDGGEFPDLLHEAYADPIVFDTALHEGGLFAMFLRERGALLPEDEQLLVAAWQTVDRSVHEVVAVEPGATLTLRNLATGDVVEVRERTASRHAAVGECYCARVVPDGATHQMIGRVFNVRPGHESGVLDLCVDGDPVALCAWVGAVSRPPRIRYTHGLADSLYDRDVVEAAVADLGDDADEETVIATIQRELARQNQVRWLDEHVPALDGLTPREAAADPTRRELLVRLLDEYERRNERAAIAGAGDPSGFAPATFDVAELRRELGLG